MDTSPASILSDRITVGSSSSCSSSSSRRRSGDEEEEVGGGLEGIREGGFDEHLVSFND